MKKTSVKSVGQLRAAWEFLSDNMPTTQELEFYDTGISVFRRSVLVAIDSERKRHLLLPVAADTRFDAATNKKVLTISKKKYYYQDRAGFWMDLCCFDGRYADVFTRLVSNVLEEITSSVPPHKTAMEVLNQWKKILLSLDREPLTQSEITGLFGELWFLNRLTEIEPSALQAWEGPGLDHAAPGVHDFRNSRLIVEVKTTGQRGAQIVTISSLHQLDCQPDESIYLLHISIEKHASGTLSIPALIVRISANGVDEKEFSKKLIACGYPLDADESLRSLYFEVTGERLYRVTSRFPRIVPASFKNERIPAGVISASYTIDLSSEYPESVSDPAGIISEMASGWAP